VAKRGRATEGRARAAVEERHLSGRARNRCFSGELELRGSLRLLLWFGGSRSGQLR
jgi:hypothetical protein